MKKLIFHGESYNTPANIGILAFRVFVGLSMAFAHGLGKIPPHQGFAGALSGMGLPMPGVLAWGAGLAEFGGGILIALGLATRFSSAALGVTMAVAAFIAHGADPFAKKEMALLYLFSCVLIFCVGAGKYSVDRMVK